MVTSVNSNTNTSLSSNSSNKTLAGNFNTFLTLLTTQLKNQNPLEPLDTNQFTQQLVQFAGVEQQLQTNAKLTDLTAALLTQQSTAALGFLGKTVSYDASTATSANSAAKWNFTPTASGTYTLKVKDADGKVVYQTTANYTANTATSFNWTQGRSDGNSVGEQTYTLEMYQGTSGTGTKMTVGGKGTATGLDFSGNVPTITIDGQTVPLSSIRKVEAK